MRLNTPQSGPAQGSFGIPPAMKKAGEDARARAEEKFQEEDAEKEEPAAEDGSSEKAQDKTPQALKELRKMGIDIDEDDIQSLFFQGFIEKDIVIWPARGNNPAYTATVRTLTAEEADYADELLMDIVGGANAKKMTNQGLEQRRVMAFLSFGVVKLNGRNIPPNPLKNADGDFDVKGNAELRHEILSKLSVAHINKLNRLHAALTITVTQMVQDPDSDFL